MESPSAKCLHQDEAGDAEERLDLSKFCDIFEIFIDFK
jgi:hypothetical protein